MKQNVAPRYMIFRREDQDDVTTMASYAKYSSIRYHGGLISSTVVYRKESVVLQTKDV